MWRCGNEKPDENTSGWLKMMKMKSGITTMKPKKKAYIHIQKPIQLTNKIITNKGL